MNILEEMRLDGQAQVDFLVANPDRLSVHWYQYVGIFDSCAFGNSHSMCPVQLRLWDKTSDITAVDSILDGGDTDGNRIPSSSAVLFRRWFRAAALPNTERIRRKILAPFVAVRKAVIQHQKDQAE